MHKLLEKLLPLRQPHPHPAAPSAYRQWVRAQLLAWARLEGQGQDTDRLVRCFVEPNTTTEVSARAVAELLRTGNTGGRGLRPQNPTDLRPLSALEAWVLQRRILLQGPAGSGKSYLLARLGLALLEGRWRGFNQPPPTSFGGLPILLDLSSYAAWLASQEESQRASGLLTFLRQGLEEAGLATLQDTLQDTLQAGQAVILADGLDEVTEAFQEPVVMALLALEQRFANVAILVSCRSDEPCGLPAERFPRHQLAPFDVTQQRQLLRWPPDEALTRAWPPEGLWQLLQQPWLAQLAANPLLLNTMARIYAHDHGLPVERAMLLERLVDIWLWRGHSITPGSQQTPVLDLLTQAGLGMADLRRMLRSLAFETITARLETTAVTPEEQHDTLIHPRQVCQRLTKLHPQASIDWAEQMLTTLCRPGGMWQHQHTRIVFNHPLVQDYLAGTYLALETNLIATVNHLARRDPGWWTVMLWAVSYRVHVLGESQLSLALAARLCPLAYPLDDLDWRRASLAAEILRVMGVSRVEQAGPTGLDLLERVRERLNLLVEEGQLQALERSMAAECLGQLGDPRFSDTDPYLPVIFRQAQEPLWGFVRISAGRCYLGWPSSAGNGNEYGNDEPLEMPYDYWIARYPVTVAQYAAFVASGAYRERRWWGTGGEHWLAQGFNTPAHWSQQCQHPNRPVTGVCWFEAMAYCRWLDQQLVEEPHSSESYGVRLTSEAEWEKAARYGDERRYPWGNEEWHPERANLADTALGHPTPVGSFPAGGSPAGVQDQLGNVWEWTLSSFQSYPYDPHGQHHQSRDDVPRSVRGGSWDSRAEQLQVTTRSALFPEARLNDVGFRVALAPREDYC